MYFSPQLFTHLALSFVKALYAVCQCLHLLMIPFSLVVHAYSWCSFQNWWHLKDFLKELISEALFFQFFFLCCNYRWMFDNNYDLYLSKRYFYSQYNDILLSKVSNLCQSIYRLFHG